MYGSYNTTDYGGYSQEIENRHQDYLNRVATTQQQWLATTWYPTRLPLPL